MGLLGRILLILLLTVAVEFGASTFLYERASQFSVREDEAHRLAEHLVIARKLIGERPIADRPAAARELVTDRYDVRWQPDAPPQSASPPRLAGMERQVLAWEPDLARSDLRLRLSPISHGSVVAGEFRLPDGSWVLFRTRGISQGWTFAIERVFVALLPAILLTALAILMIRVTLRPLRALIRAIGRVGSGEQVLVREEGPAEIRGLIHAFNAMQERIHELIESRTQALAAVGHDLRTPLSRLQLRLETLGGNDARQAMMDDTAEMEGMIQSLLTFLAGEDDPEPPVALDLAVMVATLVNDAADRAGDARYAGPPHLELMARPLLLRRAIGNLIENALHYGDRVRVALADAEGGVLLRIDDDGPGIPAGEIEAALRPFVRLDVARSRNTKGLGLGLAIVSQVVAIEKGVLTLVNLPEGGLSARIWLPR